MAEIIVYSTPLCQPCEQLKRYLTDLGVDFTAKDLMMDEDAAEFIDDQNIRTSPILQVGDTLLHGADLEPVNIDKLLGL
ncbi:MAG: glutaredoxin family protein [Proteobacteria bacterium]|nr:glutaredoxin family protein [Pseudomonadota bacterium]